MPAYDTTTTREHPGQNGQPSPRENRGRFTPGVRRSLIASIALHGGLFAVLAGAFVFRYEPPQRSPLEVAFVVASESTERIDPLPDLSTFEEPDLTEPDLTPIIDDQIAPGHSHEVMRHASLLEPPSIPPHTFVDVVYDSYLRKAATTPMRTAAKETSTVAKPDRPAARVETAPAQPTRAVPLADNPTPRYPAASKRRGHEGVAIVRVRVCSAGTVLAAEISTSSGHRILDEAALDAIRGWHFKPATRDGVATEGTTDVPVRFRLIDPS